VCIGLAFVVAGCGDSTGPGDALPPCSGALTVTVDNRTTPTFSWTPLCGANGLTVDEVNGPPGTTASVWAVGAETGLFGPAVRYGTPPMNAENLIPTVALQTGHTYRVTVLRTGGEVIIQSQGSATFTR
jgi:hypothetical protein